MATNDGGAAAGSAKRAGRADEALRSPFTGHVQTCTENFTIFQARRDNRVVPVFGKPTDFFKVARIVHRLLEPFLQPATGSY